jgi:hypothetical protein
MSGGYGWHQNSPSTSSNENKSGGHSYEDAKKEYQTSPQITVKNIGGPASVTKPALTPAVTVPSVAPKRVIAQAQPALVTSYPEAKHALKSTAANVIIVVCDVTQSMQQWPQEIFKRLPLFYNEASQYFGSNDLEILFIAHGDVRTDAFPLQVSRFGKGEELDKILASFYMRCGGGGQGDESQELVAYYLLKQVDTSSAQNVYTYFITDEASCESIDPKYVKEYLNIPIDIEMTKTKDVFAALQRKSKVFTVLCETQNSFYNPLSIKKHWENNVGQDKIIPLNDSRRVIDVMLGAIAKLTGQLDKFTQNLTSRQQGQFAHENIQAVQKSISLIGANLPSNPVLSKKKALI